MKNVFLNVLCSSGSPYPELARCSQETWDSVAVPGVETVFFFDRDYLGKLPRSVRLKGDGSLYSCAGRAIESFEWALKREGWDYMARVNASCYVRKKQLLDFCQHLAETGLFMGVGARCPEGMFLWGGAQYILSRDAAGHIVKHRSRMRPGDMDDQALSRIARESGLPLNKQGKACSLNRKPTGWLCICYEHGGQGGFEFGVGDWKAMEKAPHFIRVKQDGQRHWDMEIMRELHKAGI